MRPQPDPNERLRRYWSERPEFNHRDRHNLKLMSNTANGLCATDGYHIEDPRALALLDRYLNPSRSQV